MYCEQKRTRIFEGYKILMFTGYDLVVPQRMRLAEGEWMNSGRIELFYNGTWGHNL